MQWNRLRFLSSSIREVVFQNIRVLLHCYCFSVRALKGNSSSSDDRPEATVHQTNFLASLIRIRLLVKSEPNKEYYTKSGSATRVLALVIGSNLSSHMPVTPYALSQEVELVGDTRRNMTVRDRHASLG